MTKNKTVKKRRIDMMSTATFLFAAAVMMFIGVVGSAYINRSYAVPTSSSLPSVLNVHLDKTWGGKFAEGYESGYFPIEGVSLGGWFYGTNANDASDTNKYSLYCLEAGKAMPTDGTYTKDDDKTNTYIDKGITYIITHSYPNDNTFMASYDWQDRVFVTQYAIWLYQDRVAGIADNQASNDVFTAETKQKLLADPTFGPLVQDLVARAMAAKDLPDEPADALSVAESGITYHLSSDGKYLETDYISVNGSNGSFKSYVAVLKENQYGATLVNEEGVEVASGSTFSPTSKFKVRVPLEKLKELNKISLSLSVKGSFEHRKIYAYHHSVADRQTALVAAFDNNYQEVEKPLELNIPTGKVEISKQDITTSKELPGATLVISDCNNKEVAKWVSTNEPHFIEALPVTTDSCKYKLTETMAPEGYELSLETIEFEVKDDGSVTKVVMKNTPLTPTPDTGFDIPFIVYLAGGIILLCGIVIIYASVKPKKQN